MSFNGSGVNTEEKDEKRIKKSVEMGVQILAISDAIHYKSQGGNDGFRMQLETKPIEGLKDTDGKTIGQRMNETWWMSPKAWDNNGNPEKANWCTKFRLALLADKVGVRAEYDTLEADSAEEFVKKLVSLFKGKKARFAVGGKDEVFTNNSGEEIKFVRPNLLTFRFVESLKDVPNDKDTNLKFDELNEYDYVRMEESDPVAPKAPSADAADADADLPW